MQQETGLALIGYRWPESPKIVLEHTLAARQDLWRLGYSVDAVPINMARDLAKEQASGAATQQLKTYDA